MNVNGHATTPLAELLTPVRREVSVEPHREYELLGAHWYAKGLYTKEIKPGSRIKASKLYRVENGDFVYNRLFAWKGSFAVASAKNHDCFVSNEFPCFAVNDECLHASYLWYYFQREASWNEALGMSFGATPTSRNRLKEEKLLSMQIPLPPLPEQRRIVAKIERLAAKIDGARSIRNVTHDEADALEKSIAECVYRALAADGLKPLDQACESITDGAHVTPKFFDSGVPFIFVGNVSSGCLHFQGCKFVDPEYFDTVTEQRRPRRGDVLYSAVGATLGVPAVVDVERDFCFQRHIAIIRPKLNVIDSYFLRHMLRTSSVFGIAWKSTTGSAQPTIALRGIRALPIPIPPLAEQRRIVAYLDGLQAKVDELKRLEADSAAKLDALLPAILDRAFKSEL